MKVKANFDYRDVLLERLVKKDEIIEVSDERGTYLMNTKHNKTPFVSLVVEEQKEEKPKRSKKPKAEKVE